MSEKILSQDIITPLRNTGVRPKNTKGASTANFSDHLKKYMAEVNELQHEADKQIEDLASGQGAGLHETLIAVERANISFRMMMQLRNKIISAYEEVMRMQL